jgi:hypothetical protein
MINTTTINKTGTRIGKKLVFGEEVLADIKGGNPQIEIVFLYGDRKINLIEFFGEPWHPPTDEEQSSRKYQKGLPKNVKRIHLKMNLIIII